LQGFPKSRSLLAGNSAYIPSNFESISTQTLSSTTGTVTFSSIPSTYKHLQLRMLWRSATSGYNQTFLLSMNGDTNSSNYVRHFFSGGGTSVSAGANTSGTFSGIRSTNCMSGSDPASEFSPAVIDIVDYTSVNKNKTVRALIGYETNNVGGANIALLSGLWLSTSAITSLSITDYGGTGSASGSTFALYGIKG
jgi:hypothetical protein